MYISRGEFKDGSGYIKSNGGEGNRIIVKFEANVDVEG